MHRWKTLWPCEWSKNYLHKYEGNCFFSKSTVSIIYVFLLMFSLHQLEFVSLKESEVKDPNYEGNDCFVSFHRRTCTALSFNTVNNSFVFLFGKLFSYFHFLQTTGYFSLVQQQEHKEERWLCIGGFYLPRNISQPKIVDVLSLEAFEVFVFLVVDENKLASVLFYDLIGQLVFNTSMGKMANPSCIENDQRRRELIIGVESGRILCYFVNTIKSSNNVAPDVELNDFAINDRTKSKKPRVISPKRRRPGFQITLRTKAWVPVALGKYPVQIESVDLLEFFLVLTDDGGILCLNTSLFEPVFSINSDKFVLKPCSIFVDKFGADFLVLCKNADRTSEILEYWRQVLFFVILKLLHMHML